MPNSELSLFLVGEEEVEAEGRGAVAFAVRAEGDAVRVRRDARSELDRACALSRNERDPESL